jgi:serine/threonine protein kinase
MFRVMINIGLHLVAAFQALHGAGLCYRDINSKNLWVDEDKAEVVLSDGASITSHHLYRDRNHDTVIGMVETHPTKPGEVVLRNVGPNDWVMAPVGEPVVTVPCRKRLGVRTMVIDFGSVKGRISVD